MKRALFAVLLFALAISLSAGFHRSVSGGVQIWFPDDWTVSDDEGSLTAESPDGAVYCALEVLEEETDLDSALEIYTEVVSDYFDGFSPEAEPKKGALNGLDAYIVQGKATRDGQQWDVDVAIVSSQTAIVMFVGGNEAAVSRQYETAFQKILANLKKL